MLSDCERDDCPDDFDIHAADVEEANRDDDDAERERDEDDGRTYADPGDERDERRLELACRCGRPAAYCICD